MKNFIEKFFKKKESIHKTTKQDFFNKYGKALAEKKALLGKHYVGNKEGYTPHPAHKFSGSFFMLQVLNNAIKRKVIL